MSGRSTLLHDFVRRCRGRLLRPKLLDSTGVSLSGGMTLVGVIVLRRLLERLVLDADERHVGVLIPPSAGGFVTNLALALSGRVAINLNYSLSAELIEEAARQAGLRRILTSRQVLERLDLQLQTPTVFLDEVRTQATWIDKAVAALVAFALPASLIIKLLRVPAPRLDEPLAIIFTAGSSGRPKGVVLSYGNVQSNLEAINQVFRMGSNDVVLGVLPFFHAFGYTGTLWSVATLDAAGAYHTSPLEARQIGRLARRSGATILLSTPTFLRSYMARCSADDFAQLDTVVTGAERLPRELADQFEARFGVRPLEGYGATELSPVVSVNLPSRRRGIAANVGAREGSVGRPVPGVEVRITDPESGAVLDAGAVGLIEVRGPGVMQGYYERDDLTASVMHDGWYVTGDIGTVDADGFVILTDRAIRISKIAGEMVAHSRIEEELQRTLESERDETPRVAVTAVADAQKGERLVVLYVGEERADELRQGLREAGLPPLMVPAADSFLRVEAIPVLGAGKLDLKAVRATAEQRLGAPLAR